MNRSIENDFPVFIGLSLSFLVGSVFGSIFAQTISGALFLPDAYISEKYNEIGFAVSFVIFIGFHFISFLMGTSFLGVTLIPLLTVFRGFFLSFASASIIMAYPSDGIIMALIKIGIPAAFSIPCFFAISSEAFISSRSLLRMCSGAFCRCKLSYRRALFCFPFLILGALVETKLIPYILLKCVS